MNKAQLKVCKNRTASLVVRRSSSKEMFIFGSAKVTLTTNPNNPISNPKKYPLKIKTICGTAMKLNLRLNLENDHGSLLLV